MIYNVVTNSLVINEVRRCRYFKKNLGIVSTVDKGVNREFNDKDRFAYYYQTTYKTFIYAQGNVGNIKFYIDPIINDPVMALYYGENFEEFIYDVDFTLIREKGIDHFLGHILKETDRLYEERAKDSALKKVEDKKDGDPYKVINNPGAVTYEDVKAYLEMQNGQRFKKTE